MKDKALSIEEMSTVRAGEGKGYPACKACLNKLYPPGAIRYEASGREPVFNQCRKCNGKVV